MRKYKEIAEVVVGEIEVEANTLEEAIKKVRGYREEAGNTIKHMYTEEMKARIFYDNDESIGIRLI